MEASELFAILNSAGDATFVANLTGEICHWSPRAEALLGFSSNQVLEQQCAQVLAGKDEYGNAVCRAECKILELARTAGTIPAYDLHAATAWGSRKWLSVSIIVVPIKQNTSPLVVHLMRNIDPRKRLENATREILVQIGHLTGGQADELLGKSLPEPIVTLTPRERSVLTHLAKGMSTREVAANLGISIVTVRNHIQRLMDKLGSHTRLEAVLTSIRRGLI